LLILDIIIFNQLETKFPIEIVLIKVCLEATAQGLYHASLSEESPPKAWI